jgi:hypothetical protein
LSTIETAARPCPRPHPCIWAGIVSPVATIPAQIPIWDGSRPDVQELPQSLAETPQIINTTIEGVDDWSRMGEMTID